MKSDVQHSWRVVGCSPVFPREFGGHGLTSENCHSSDGVMRMILGDSEIA